MNTLSKVAINFLIIASCSVVLLAASSLQLTAQDASRGDSMGAAGAQPVIEPQYLGLWRIEDFRSTVTSRPGQVFSSEALRGACLILQSEILETPSIRSLTKSLRARSSLAVLGETKSDDGQLLKVDYPKRLGGGVKKCDARLKAIDVSRVELQLRMLQEDGQTVVATYSLVRSSSPLNEYDLRKLEAVGFTKESLSPLLERRKEDK